MWAGTYGYEVIAGLGLGLASPPYFMLIATSIAEKDMSVGTGALSKYYSCLHCVHLLLKWSQDMVRTLGGCVAVAICSAVHREYLNDRLSSFLSPTQIAAVLKSSGYIAQLPENTRNRIGKSFGGSYNKQFQVMLAFAGLNVVVTVILALIRKRLGIFGTMPTRKDGNEFTKAADEKDNDMKGAKQADTVIIAADVSPALNQGHDDIGLAHTKHGAN
jgi:hypothetical protein